MACTLYSLARENMTGENGREFVSTKRDGMEEAKQKKRLKQADRRDSSERQTTSL